MTHFSHQLIAFASGKGGVGKTVLAATYAHALVQQGQKVLLFDGDFGLANIDIQLGLSPTHDLADWLNGTHALNQIITHDSQTGLDVITGRNGNQNLLNLPIEKIQQIHDDLLLLATHYDTVVVDLGSGLEKSTQLLAQTTGTVFVICTDEPTALIDAYAFIRQMHTQNPQLTIRVIVNSADSEKQGVRTFETLEKTCTHFLHFQPVLQGIVRRDTHVKQAVCAQQPLLTLFPDTPAAQDIQKLLEK